MKSNLLVILLVFLGIFSCQNTANNKLSPLTKDYSAKLDSLDQTLKKYEATHHLPGFVVALFNQDSTFFSKGYGLANLNY